MEKDLQNALDSAVGAEFEIEYENAQIANELVIAKYSLLALLFALTTTVYAPKTI